MSAREHDPAYTVLDIEIAYQRKIAKLARHEDEIRARERERAYRRMLPLLPFDPDVYRGDGGFPGCRL